MFFPEIHEGFPDSSAGKESACNAGHPSSIPGSGRPTGEGKAYPLQYSRASLVAQMVKNPLAIRETWVETIPWRPELPTDQRHPRLFGADLSNTLLRRSESI